MANKLRELLELAVGYHSIISFLGYIIGIIWFIALCHPSLNNRTYFSENALLPGMVDTQFAFGHAAKSLKSEVEKHSELYSENFPLWLMDKMTTLGLESYQQNFTVHFPEKLSLLSEQISGTNVYGILRAPRTARTEALVFLIPQKKSPFHELVLLLSLAEHFRNNVYWSKDIIFLVVDQNEIGIQSWLDEYHGIQSKCKLGRLDVKSSQMQGRAGSIQAAINLELDDEDISSMEIIIESLNGQLPNLDLVNMVIRLCQSEGIPAALKTLSVCDFNDGWDEYRRSLSNMVSMMLSQASGRPSANHGLFPKYGIEAVTLRGRKEDNTRTVGLRRLGRSLEGMFRSLNSLLEKFHQSFFFYLLPSTSRYVSIGLYMPPLGCVMIGPILAAISCWIKSVEEKEQGQKSKNKETGNKAKNDEEQKDEKITEKRASSSTKTEEFSHKNDKEEFAFTRIPRHFGKVLRVILAGQFVGLLIYISPYLFQYIEVSSLHLQPSELVLLVLFATFLLGSNLPFLLRLRNNLKERDVLLLKSMSLVIFTCQVGCLATINFSFGFFLAIFTLPAYLFVCSTQSRLRRLIQVVLVGIASPPLTVFILTFVYSFFTNETNNLYEIMSKSKTLYTQGILSSLRDSVLLGTWSYPVTMLLVLPNWLLFWSIAWM